MADFKDLVRNRDFVLYWSGVVFSQIGTRGTVAANLYHVYHLTGSVAQTGLVGAAQAVALLLLSPLGGVYADRLDRRRLLQVTQGISLVVAGSLAWLTLAGVVQAWHIIVAVAVTTAAATFDQPVRNALIPALVPRTQLAQAFALLNPSREVAILVGPAVGGVLISIAGPGLMYAVNTLTYAGLIIVLAFLRVNAIPGGKHTSILESIRIGARYVVDKRIIISLMGVDLVATLFGAYRVLLPAIAADVLHVGPTGYGILSSAPSAGAILVTYFVVKEMGRNQRLGILLLFATVGYGAFVTLFPWMTVFALSVVVVGLAGACDAVATSIRHAAVQLETPDDLRGRVTSIYQMSSRGGPALGDTLIGAVAGVVGPVLALTGGGLIVLGVAGSLLARGNVVREYTVDYSGADT